MKNSMVTGVSMAERCCLRVSVSCAESNGIVRLYDAGAAVGRRSSSELEQVVERLFAPEGSDGLLLTADEVSRSHEVRGEKNPHSFATSFGDTRALIGCVHSKRAPGSK